MRWLNPCPAAPPCQLAAFSARAIPDAVQLRADFLLPPSRPLPAGQLVLLVDERPGSHLVSPVDLPAGFSSQDWDSAQILTLTADQPPVLRSVGTPTQLAPPQTPSLSGAVSWEFPISADPARLRLQLHWIPSESGSRAEVTDRLSLSDPAPAQAPLLLAFWDTLDARTPAALLRSWDGAHTGPNGTRHGLKHLLSNAAAAQVPLTLLDLKTPQNLQALDFLGQIPNLAALQQAGLLDLADGSKTAPYAAAYALVQSRKLTETYGLPLGNAAFSPLLSGEYDTAFAYLPGATRLVVRRGSQRLIPLPAHPYASKSTALGVDASLLHRLLLSARSPDPYDGVVAGGSLASTAWADADSADLAYLASLPWVKILSIQDLTAFSPVSAPASLCPDLLCTPRPFALRPTSETGQFLPANSAYAALQPSIASQLQSLPANALTDAAWQAFQQAAQPAASYLRQRLQANYLPNLRFLLYAAQWAEAPVSHQDCVQDLDLDGQAECVLSNAHWLLILDPLGARLVTAVFSDGGRPQPVIALPSQFAVGNSDPLDWKYSIGPLADSREIPGAFFHPDEPLEVYTPSLSPNTLALTAPSGRQLTVSLNGTEVVFTLRRAGDGLTRFPLRLAPSACMHSASPFQAQATSLSWIVSPTQAFTLTRSTAQWSFSTSCDSAAYLSQPEDPSRENPPGHYLPFPLAVLDIGYTQILELHLAPSSPFTDLFYYQ
ncbi:hypothetical protein ADN01_09315 [Levilinea saccharolytica]|uniref:Uncharacterized protein n=1 Tax=Levilinea saccharolytica TaxID=229921 RepID=A0A0P6XN46_9CHLR|nr:hypothetical protein ADN01_09315 [Levilinea saccharolytica]GAP17928.1 hypothetical protein LSAC_01808 [Levilinea saccharolytica]